MSNLTKFYAIKEEIAKAHPTMPEGLVELQANIRIYNEIKVSAVDKFKVALMVGSTKTLEEVAIDLNYLRCMEVLLYPDEGDPELRSLFTTI